MILTKFEQSAFTLATKEVALAVDIGSYTSQVSLASLPPVQAALVSHIHGDHFYEANLHLLKAPVYTVSEVGEAITDRSLTVYAHKEGDQVGITGTPFTVTYTPSDHGPQISRPVENVGFLIEAEGKSIYFLGDMAVGAPAFPKPFDVVMIPVGNKGYTFGPEEAVTYIKHLDWHGLTVPIHYHGSLDPRTCEQFADLASDFCQVRVLPIGSSLHI